MGSSRLAPLYHIPYGIHDSAVLKQNRTQRCKSNGQQCLTGMPVIQGKQEVSSYSDMNERWRFTPLRRNAKIENKPQDEDIILLIKWADL